MSAQRTRWWDDGFGGVRTRYWGYGGNLLVVYKGRWTLRNDEDVWLPRRERQFGEIAR